MGYRKTLNDEDLMPFGKHKGTPLGEMDDSYFDWFLKQAWSEKFPDLVEYAKKEEEPWTREE